MKTIMLFLLVFAGHTCLSQEYLRDTVYFNKDWQLCTKNDYLYFRLMKADSTTMPPGKLIKFLDYYRSGVMQAEGYLLARDTSQKVGLTTRFDKKGRPEEYYLYNYKYGKKFFKQLIPYLDNIEPCDSNVDMFIYTYRNGHVKKSGFFLSDNALGNCSCRAVCTWKYYNPYNRHIVDVYDYTAGKIDGRHFTYYSNDKLWKERYYKNGKATGTWKKYYSNGTLRKKKTIKEKV